MGLWLFFSRKAFLPAISAISIEFLSEFDTKKIGKETTNSAKKNFFLLILKAIEVKYNSFTFFKE